jgi:hypothetical protein
MASVKNTWILNDPGAVFVEPQDKVFETVNVPANTLALLAGVGVELHVY